MITATLPASEGVRRLMLFIAHYGTLTAVSRAFGIASSTLHQYISLGRVPTLEKAVHLKHVSSSLIDVEDWLPPPHREWPPDDLQAACQEMFTPGP